MSAPETAETKACPWCGETILAVAKKCKHCGEFLTDERPDTANAPEVVDDPLWVNQGGIWYCTTHGLSTCTKCPDNPTPAAPVADPAASFVCPTCSEGFADSRGLYVHQRDEHPTGNESKGETREEYLARINGTRAAPKKKTGYWAKAVEEGQMRGKRISQVGVRTDAGLACPRCGGTSFKSKRSAAGKVGFGVLAAKTQVRCEACGMTFKRG